LLFAFIWRSIPAAILAALAGSSVSRIGGMIIAARGFWFFWPVKRTPPVGAWQRVLFNCPYGHRKNQTYIAAKHPEHFYVKDNLGSTRAVVDEAVEVVEAIYRLDNGMVLTTGFKCIPAILGRQGMKDMIIR
jgi:hypothetical protein